MRLLIDNLLESATITVNGSNSSFPKENLYSDIITERTEFDDYVVIDLGSTTAVNTVAYFSTTDDITIQGNATDSWGSPSYSSVLSSNVTFISQSHRYWRIFTNETDTRLGYFYLGNYMQLPEHSFTNVPVPETTDVVSVTSGGQIYNTEGVLVNVEEIEFPIVTSSEWATFNTWFRTSDRARNHVLVRFEDDMTTYPPYLARIEEFEPSREGKSYAFNLTFREAK